MLCVLILYISSGVGLCSLKSTSNHRFFEKLFKAILFTLSSLLRGNRRKNNLFWCLAWDSNPGFSSNKLTHYLLDHGVHSTSVKLFQMWKYCLNCGEWCSHPEILANIWKLNFIYDVILALKHFFWEQLGFKSFCNME